MKDFGSTPCCRRRPAGAASNRVKRGGNWNNNANNLRAANRNNNNPDNHNNNIGFRCSKTITLLWSTPGPARAVSVPSCSRVWRTARERSPMVHPGRPWASGFRQAPKQCLGRVPWAPR